MTVPAPSGSDGQVADAAQARVIQVHESIWGRLGERFGLVALRPRLAGDMKLKKLSSDTFELTHVSSGRSIELSGNEARIVKKFDGNSTIAEIIVSGMASNGLLNIETVLHLVDRVVRAEMLQDFPPNMFRQLDSYLARRAITMARQLTGEGVGDLSARPPEPATEGGAPEAGKQPISQYEQMPWRPRTPLLAERAKFLRSIELTKQFPLPVIGQLAEVAHEEAFPAAKNIVHEGQASDRFYIIKTGEVNVIKQTEEGPKRIARLGAGDYFGETGLLEVAARSATVRAGPSRPVVAFSFEPETFERIIAPYVSSFRGKQHVSQRREKLAQVPLFRTLSGADLERLAQVVQEVRVPGNTDVFVQGDAADRLYVIVDGEVRVVRDGVPVADLHEGDFFGETGLLFTEVRTATVHATCDTTLWALDKVAFQRLIREHLLKRRDMMPTLLNRI